jgi:hypothetical protein
VGQGYIGASVPPEMVAGGFDSARAAWSKAGRQGSRRLVGLAYFGLGDTEQGRRNVYDDYSIAGDEIARTVVNGFRDSAEAVEDVVKAYEDLEAAELIFCQGLDDPSEVPRLAEIAPL